MGWLIFILLALAIFVALWRFARFDKAALQFLGAGLLLAMAGYVWQGQPGMPGQYRSGSPAGRVPTTLPRAS